MQLNRISRNKVISAATMVAVGLVANSSAYGEAWIGGTSTNWDDAPNWSPATIPDSASAIADFNTKDVTGTEIVNVVSSRTVNSMVFGDTAGADGTYNLTGSSLSLFGTTPTVTVNNTVSGPVVISNVLAGATGLIKSGAGTLSLTGVNTFTGGITVNGGVLDTSSANNTLVRQFVTLSNGGTWKFGTGTNVAANAFGLTGSTQTPPTFNAAVGGVFVPAGQTGTIISTVGTSLGQVGGGAGSTLNVVIGNGTTFQARGSWRSTTTANTGGELGALNLSTGTTANFDLGMNVSGNTDRFTTAANTSVAFQNTAVDIGNGVTWYLRAGSPGGTVPIGALSGGSTAVMYGGRSSGGAEANYSIGSLNTNTTFAGTIKSEVFDTPTANGATNITKVGTGTLTLSGTLSYIPSNNATFARKGGVTTITGGTLALSNGATIPAGVSATAQTTIDIRSGTVLDVSGTTNTFVDGTAAIVTGYSSQANQQIIGPGTIKGNFNHAAGLLAPANTMGTSTSQYNNVVAGTMNIDGKLNFMGTGTIAFDLSPSTVSGNDLITVTDADLSGTPTLALNRLSGGGIGTYTIISSTNNLTGSASGWNIGWQGRGATPTLDWTTDPKKLTLTVTELGQNINWSGVNGGTWDINNTASWYNTAPSFPNPDKYFEADTVNFLDLYDGVNAATNTSITLNSTVIPTSVVFNSDTTNYTISGTGKISGATNLVKQGTSTLTMTTANDYIGTTTISGGGAIVGVIPAVSSLILNNGTYMATTANTTIPATSVTGATNTIGTSGTGTTTMSALTGTGNLTINQSSGTTDLTANNSGFTGGITLTGSGTIRVGGATSIGAANAVTINSGVLATNQTATGSNDIGSLAGAGGTLTGFQGGNTPGAGVVRTWNIGALNTDTVFNGIITDGKSPSATAITKVGTGTLTLTGASSYTGVTTISDGALQLGNGGSSGELNLFAPTVVNNASLILNRSDFNIFGPGVTGTGSMSVIGTGTTAVFGTLTYTGATNISNGRLIKEDTGIQNGSPLNISASGVLEAPLNGSSTKVTSVGALSITGAGSRIELHDNDLISNYGAGPSNYNDIVNHVKSGLVLLGGTGTEGIASAEVDAQTVAGTMLAVVDDGDPNIAGAITELSGFAVPNPTTSTLVKFTWFGDSNLDGVVDGSDYALIDTGFTAGGALGGWVFGDYDYSGVIDGSDYALIDTGFISQTGALPEPTTLGLLGLGAMGMLRRRRQA